MPFTRSQAERVMLDRPARFLMVNRNGVVNERLNMLLLQVGLLGFTLLAGNYIEVIYVRFSLVGGGKQLNGRRMNTGAIGQCSILGNDHAGIAGSAQVFSWVKAIRASCAKAARLFASPSCLMGLC